LEDEARLAGVARLAKNSLENIRIVFVLVMPAKAGIQDYQKARRLIPT